MIRKVFLIYSLLFISACSPYYVLRAAYEEGKILLAREKISDVINNPSTTPDEVQKLKLVLAAREYSKSLGLTPKDSFTMYSKTDHEILAWVLMAARKDAFELHSWWFPIVGYVPYKGFFTKENAQKAAKELEKQGYETWIRGTTAFSTLGWFNDPIVSPTLRQNAYSIVNTILHEIVHSSIWFKNQVPFNESLANFVGMEASRSFFRTPKNFYTVPDINQQNLKQLQVNADLTKVQELKISKMLNALVVALQKVYNSSLSYSAKLKEREQIFQKHALKLKEQFPKLKILQTVNNAEIMQLKIYYTKLDSFQQLFEKTNSNWNKFFTQIENLKNNCEQLKEKCDPFALLDRKFSNQYSEN